MAKNEGLDLSKPFTPEPPEETRAEMTEEDQAFALNEIMKMNQSNVSRSIDMLLAGPGMQEMSTAGGTVLNQIEFGKRLIRFMLIDDNRILKPHMNRILERIDAIIKSAFPAGEELDAVKKEEVAGKILQVIQEEANS